jgi:PEGA domain
MQILRRLLALLLCSAVAAWAQGNSFDKVRYNGGSVDSKVDPKDWHNQLTVTPDMITLDLKDGKKLEIPPKTVTSLSYGQEAHRRVGTMIALAILVAPIALFGLFHKTRLHYIGIQYTIPDNKTGGILLQGDKDNYRAILVALQGVTGVPVAVGEKDREFVPVSVRTEVTKGEEEKAAKEKTTETNPTESKPTESAPSETAKGTVNVSSNPAGADVLVDGDFVGNSPAALKLTPGKHTITVKISGYGEWSKEITVQSGSDVQLTANLEKPSPQNFANNRNKANGSLSGLPPNRSLS